MAVTSEQPRKIILGAEEGGILEAAIRDEYDNRSLQEIADTDTTEAIEALAVGLHALILYYGAMRLRLRVEHEGELEDGQDVPVINREDDGEEAFRGAARKHVEQSAAWVGETLLAGRDVVVCALRSSEPHTLPIADDQTVMLATLRHPEGL